MSTIGDRLRQARKQHKWTQQELERQSGVDQGIITNIERGHTPNPTVQTLQKLADALDTTVDALLGKGASPIDTSKPPADLWQALGWPESWIADGVRDWPAYSETRRITLIEQARTLYETQRHSNPAV